MTFPYRVGAGSVSCEGPSVHGIERGPSHSDANRSLAASAFVNRKVMVRLKARNGHELDAYVARPTTGVRGGVVIAQEMYGVNRYLRSVCDFYAGHGYVAVAPALYDRKQRGLEFA